MQSPASFPSARRDAAIAYDAATQNVVLYGGCCAAKGAALSDTWIWNGSTWTKQTPTRSAGPRDGARMAYDAVTLGVVLFGGADTNDTWSWNGATWFKLATTTTPSARDDAALTYDDATQSIILFGGVTPSNAVLADTWQLK
jgi:hypothetical protein